MILYHNNHVIPKKIKQTKQKQKQQKTKTKNKKQKRKELYKNNQEILFLST